MKELIINYPGSVFWFALLVCFQLYFVLCALANFAIGEPGFFRKVIVMLWSVFMLAMMVSMNGWSLYMLQEGDIEFSSGDTPPGLYFLMGNLVFGFVSYLGQALMTEFGFVNISDQD